VACVRVVWLLVGLAFHGMPWSSSTLSQKTVLARAGALVARYADELPRLVATETLVQELTAQGDDLVGVPFRRRSVAEFAWVALPDALDPIGFRDVIEVDGHAVGPGRKRLVELLHGSEQASWAQARAILQESARHNLSPGSRNFNLPTVAMFFLLPELQGRFSWKRRTEPSVAVWELEFRERSRPTVIRQGDGRSAFSRGRVWVEAATGTVLRTDLVLEIDVASYRLTTRFERVASMDLVLPVRLDERYTTPDEIVTGSATYTNYRRFQTGARLIP
jgi:hypothetical protein